MPKKKNDTLIDNATEKSESGESVLSESTERLQESSPTVATAEQDLSLTLPASTPPIIVALTERETTLIIEATGEYFPPLVVKEGRKRLADVNDSVVVREKLLTLLNAYRGQDGQS